LIVECRTVAGVKFGPKSVAAIEEIRRKRQLASMLRIAIPAGTIANLFVGNDSLKAAYSIYGTDFEMMGRAVAAVPAIERAVLVRIAQMAALDTSGPESEFWKQIARGISNGCTAVQ
jgi:hypothetical protein